MVVRGLLKMAPKGNLPADVSLSVGYGYFNFLLPAMVESRSMWDTNSQRLTLSGSPARDAQ